MIINGPLALKLVPTIEQKVAVKNEAAKNDESIVKTSTEPTTTEANLGAKDSSTTVQPWGTGEDDCLSRIIEKHYGVSAYSEEGQEIMQKVIKANPEIYNNGRKTIQNGAITDAKPNSPETLLYDGDKVNLPGSSPKAQEDKGVSSDNSGDGNANGELNPEKDVEKDVPPAAGDNSKDGNENGDLNPEKAGNPNNTASTLLFKKNKLPDPKSVFEMPKLPDPQTVFQVKANPFNQNKGVAV